MLLREPPRTNFDLHFKVLGVPVRVHPFFWLIAILLGAGTFQNPREPKAVLLWVGVMFVSILVHEMGHALAIRRFGWRPWVTLHWLGGLASHEKGYGNRSSTSTEVMISLAGPFAGFAFGGLVATVVALAGRPDFVINSVLLILGFEAPFILLAKNVWLSDLVYQLFFINLLWGLINLFPVYPLDGGQVARELLVAQDTSQGVVRSLKLSIVTAIGLAVYALFRGSTFMMIMFGLLAYSSWAAMKQYLGQGGGFGGGFGRDYGGGGWSGGGYDGGYDDGYPRDRGW